MRLRFTAILLIICHAVFIYKANLVQAKPISTINCNIQVNGMTVSVSGEIQNPAKDQMLTFLVTDKESSSPISLTNQYYYGQSDSYKNGLSKDKTIFNKQFTLNNAIPGEYKLYIGGVSGSPPLEIPFETKAASPTGTIQGEVPGAFITNLGTEMPSQRFSIRLPRNNNVYKEYEKAVTNVNKKIYIVDAQQNRYMCPSEGISKEVLSDEILITVDFGLMSDFLQNKINVKSIDIEALGYQDSIVPLDFWVYSAQGLRDSANAINVNELYELSDSFATLKTFSLIDGRELKNGLSINWSRSVDGGNFEAYSYGDIIYKNPRNGGEKTIIVKVDVSSANCSVVLKEFSPFVISEMIGIEVNGIKPDISYAEIGKDITIDLSNANVLQWINADKAVFLDNLQLMYGKDYEIVFNTVVIKSHCFPVPKTYQVKISSIGFNDVIFNQVINPSLTQSTLDKNMIKAKVDLELSQISYEYYMPDTEGIVLPESSETLASGAEAQLIWELIAKNGGTRAFIEGGKLKISSVPNSNEQNEEYLLRGKLIITENDGDNTCVSEYNDESDQYIFKKDITVIKQSETGVKRVIINEPTSSLHISKSGRSSINLTAFVEGSSNQQIIWSVEDDKAPVKFDNPAVGLLTLKSTGVFSGKFRIKAKSAEDPNMVATKDIIVRGDVKNISIVDEQNQPIKNLTVVNGQAVKNLKTIISKDVYIDEGDDEVIWTSNSTALTVNDGFIKAKYVQNDPIQITIRFSKYPYSLISPAVLTANIEAPDIEVADLEGAGSAVLNLRKSGKNQVALKASFNDRNIQGEFLWSVDSNVITLSSQSGSEVYARINGKTGYATVKVKSSLDTLSSKTKEFNIKVNSLELYIEPQPVTHYIAINDNVYLNAKIGPDEFIDEEDLNEKVTWQVSQGSDCVKLSAPDNSTEHGAVTVTGTKAGTANIEAVYKANTLDETVYTYEINVVNDLVQISSIAWKTAGEAPPVSLNIGEALNLSDYIVNNPQNATGVKYQFRTEDNNYAEINSNKVVAKKEGIVTLYAKAYGVLDSHTDEITLVLSIIQPLTAIAFKADTIKKVMIGDSLRYTENDILLNNGQSKPTGAVDFTWVSSNPDIAVIDKQGYIKPNKAGATNITVNATLGDTLLSDTITLTVSEKNVQGNKGTERSGSNHIVAIPVLQAYDSSNGILEAISSAKQGIAYINAGKEFQLTKDMVYTLSSSSISNLKIIFENGEVCIDKELIKKLNNKTGNDILISLVAHNNKVSCVIKTKEELFNNEKITIKFPFANAVNPKFSVPVTLNNIISKSICADNSISFEGLSGVEYSVFDNVKSFSDLSDALWAQTFIESLASREIIKGVGDDKFEPNRQVTREEFVSMIVRALAIPSVLNTSDFSDVSNNHWAYENISKAYGKGIIKGQEGNEFGISKSITREDAAVIISRAANLLIDSNILNDLFLDDYEISEYARHAVYACKEKGVISGNNGRFYPKELLTRAEASKLIYNMLVSILMK